MRLINSGGQSGVRGAHDAVPMAKALLTVFYEMVKKVLCRFGDPWLDDR